MYVNFWVWMATVVGVQGFAFYAGRLIGYSTGYRAGHLKGYERGSTQGLQEPEIEGKP